MDTAVRSEKRKRAHTSLDQWSNVVNQWYNLPQDILVLILKHLNTRIDFYRLRAVCTSWRSSLSSLEPIQLSYLSCSTPPFVGVSFKEPQTFEIKRNAFFLVSPPHQSGGSDPDGACLAQLTIGPQQERWSLMNLQPDRPKTGVNYLEISLLEHQIVEIARSYELEFTESVSRCVMSSKICKLVSLSDTIHRYDYFFLLALNDGKLAIWGEYDDEWYKIEDEEEGEGEKEKSYFVDIICYDGGFYTTDSKGRLFEVLPVREENIWWRRNVNRTPLFDSAISCARMVQSKEDLYLISIEFKKPQQVYILGDDCEWRGVKSIGDDVVFFVLSRPRIVISVSTKYLQWGTGNCIYYSPSDGRWELWKLSSSGFRREAAWETKKTIPVVSEDIYCVLNV